MIMEIQCMPTIHRIWGSHSGYKEPYFLGYKDIYKQFERMVISSPLSPVITKFVGKYQAN